MKFTLPKRNPKLVHVFADVDGTKYYQNERGDIVNHRGELVTLTEEENIRAHLDEINRINTTTP